MERGPSSHDVQDVLRSAMTRRKENWVVSLESNRRTRCVSQIQRTRSASLNIWVREVRD
jgi:hypothetical protein